MILGTYRTVEHILTGISALLDMTLECTRIEWLQKFETAEQIARYRHDGTPIVKFSAILDIVSITHIEDCNVLTFGAEKTVTNSRSLKNS